MTPPKHDRKLCTESNLPDPGHSVEKKFLTDPLTQFDGRRMVELSETELEEFFDALHERYCT